MDYQIKISSLEQLIKNSKDIGNQNKSELISAIAKIIIKNNYELKFPKKNYIISGYSVPTQSTVLISEPQLSPTYEMSIRKIEDWFFLANENITNLSNVTLDKVYNNIAKYIDCLRKDPISLNISFKLDEKEEEIIVITADEAKLKELEEKILEIKKEKESIKKELKEQGKEIKEITEKITGVISYYKAMIEDLKSGNKHSAEKNASKMLKSAKWLGRNLLAPIGIGLITHQMNVHL